MRWLAALVLLVAACSAQPPVSASATPSPSPSTCRLPVISGSVGQGSGPQTAGFLTLQGGGFNFSPAADAGDGMYYDKPLARWVPSGPPALSSDGKTYAYLDGVQNSSRVHVVETLTKRDTVLVDGGAWTLVGLGPDGVYLMKIEFLPDSPAFGVLVLGHGLWMVPLTGAAPIQLTADDRQWTLGVGAAWGSGSTVNIAGAPNDIIRLDLKTRQPTVWFPSGKRSSVLGTDDRGTPLIMSDAGDEELWLVPTPDTRVEIWSGPMNGPRPYAPVAFDGGTIWFSSANMTHTWTIFRYSGTGLEVMANFTDHPVSVAGPCA
jgi:hypothetical protein